MIQINKYLALAIVYIISIVGTVLFSWWFRHIDWSLASDSSKSVAWACSVGLSLAFLFLLHVLLLDGSNK